MNERKNRGGRRAAADRRNRHKKHTALLTVLALCAVLAAGAVYWSQSDPGDGGTGMTDLINTKDPAPEFPNDTGDKPDKGDAGNEVTPPGKGNTGSEITLPGEGDAGGEITQSGDWNLLLVNPWNELSENYEVTLKQLKNGMSVDERCYPDLQAMMDACRAEGLEPLICSSFRTWEKQESLFNSKIQRLINAGYSEETARVEAAKAIAPPGTSEHQLGLAVDIVDINNQHLDKSQEQTAVQQWLIAHSWEYGFILRYPNDKSEITGIIYEPWHYRYVGREAAQEIFEQEICLEEYLQNKAADAV